MHYQSIEEVIADDRFQAWYYKNDEPKAEQWEEWLLQNQQYKGLVQESIAWMHEHQLNETEVSSEQVEAAFRKLSGSLNAPVVNMNRRKWWIPAAAAVIIFLIAGFIFWNKANDKTTLNSTYGAISHYSLPDGSQVTLNANSEITLSKEWEKGTDREVWLKGEAFFKVQKTPMKNKFIVHTNAMDIIVTGTQFNAIAREDESSVLLTEGSVTLRTHDGKEIHMKPGDFVKLENNMPSLQNADQDRILAWKQSRLDFEKTPINEVAKIISRHYGIKVTVSDKAVGESTISGIMPNDNLDVLIQALEGTGHYKVTKANNEIIISGP
jgi:transmembrane sensor